MPSVLAMTDALVHVFFNDSDRTLQRQDQARHWLRSRQQHCPHLAEKYGARPGHPLVGSQNDRYWREPGGNGRRGRDGDWAVEQDCEPPSCAPFPGAPPPASPRRIRLFPIRSRHHWNRPSINTRAGRVGRVRARGACLSTMPFPASLPFPLTAICSEQSSYPLIVSRI